MTVTTPAGYRRPISAGDVRIARFPTAFRGYAPAAVHDFLHRVAEELADLHRQLAAVRAENDRIKQHLKQWQTDHAATCRREPDRQPVRGRWPVNQQPTRYPHG